jgi:pimeloyl-ACP methyl ester carboxylesterase
LSYTQISFDSVGVRLDGWHFPAGGDTLAGPGGRPVVVMAHGFGGTKDSGLAPFAEAFAAAGAEVLAFDYTGFGASDGEPRQIVSLTGQLADYRAAMRAAAALPGVDANRLVLWGVSLSGGTVLAAAADREDVAAVVSLTPLVDGRAAAAQALRSTSPAVLARSAALGVRAKIAAARGKAPVTMPLVGRPGELAALALPGQYEDYLSIAGPTWRNEVGASVTAELGGHRPIRFAARLRAPLLVQVADFDRSAPPASAMKAAVRGRAEVRHYPCDHFDVHVGKPWHQKAIDDAVYFLGRKLAAAREVPA